MAAEARTEPTDTDNVGPIEQVEVDEIQRRLDVYNNSIQVKEGEDRSADLRYRRRVDPVRVGFRLPRTRTRSRLQLPSVPGIAHSAPRSRNRGALLLQCFSFINHFP